MGRKLAEKDLINCVSLSSIFRRFPAIQVEVHKNNMSYIEGIGIRFINSSISMKFCTISAFFV